MEEQQWSCDLCEEDAVKLAPSQWGGDRERWPVVFAWHPVTHSLGMFLQE
jgi:hypothetical protein